MHIGGIKLVQAEQSADLELNFERLRSSSSGSSPE